MVSVVIVNYHVKKELFECIESIYNSKPKTKYEIIVVDNDEEKTIGKELQKRFPKVIYIPNENKGFGQGNNIGAKSAKGENFFFLNPDTKIFPETVDNLATFLQKNKKAGIVAPLLCDKNNEAYKLQGVKELTPFRALVVFSFINKLFPKNKVYRDYYLLDWDKKTLKKVDVAPGTAFMIRKDIFEKAGGFDEKFFLYFEEFDLCKRVKSLEWKIFILPASKAYHVWGSSTRQRDDLKSIFQKSRFYYFKKHFSILPALLTEAFLRINKYSLMLMFILMVGAFLRFNRIYQILPFIGDQAWFYLSARDMLQSGRIPLVGIPSSHPWLHQGALWTYILSLGFLTFGYSPYTGGFISIFIDILTIYFIYKLGSLMFSQRFGIIAALLYTFSPIVVFNSQLAFHTSPIPLLTLFYLYSLVQWVRGSPKCFPVIILLLAFLYNFEIATFPLAIAFLSVLLFGFWQKKKWAQKVLSPRYMVLSLIAFTVPMTPMLMYDFGHGFPQTFRFLAWIGYRFLVFFGYPPVNPEITSANFSQIINFISFFYKRLIFLPSTLLANTIAILSLLFFYITLFKQSITKKYNTSSLLLGITYTISFAGILATKTTSEAYLLILFPTSIFIIAFFLDRLLQLKREFTPLTIFLIILISFLNGYSVINLEKSQGFSDRLQAAKSIVSQARGRGYNLIGEGNGSEYPSFTMNYEYLTWWLGHAPSKEKEKLEFIISEDRKGIHVRPVINN
jgi:GT2 family glycosyltransferase